MTIDPHFGIGNIRFGMTVADVRRVVGSPFTSFRKTPTSTFPTDAFDDLGIHVFYKPPGICEAVEIASPGEANFEGQQMIGTRFSDIERLLHARDPNLETDETGLTSHALGIGIFAPEISDNPNASIEAVIVFEQGYFD